MARAREVRGLNCEEPFRTAAGKILWTRFDELMSFRDAVRTPKSKKAAEEAVHDMRVASRRLRAALEAFVDVFPKGSYRTMLKTVKGLADALGDVRDADVLMKRLEATRKGRPGSQRLALDTLLSELDAGRHQAIERLEVTLEDLERSDFQRRFALFVARETA